MRPNEQQTTVQVSWHATPPTPAQLAAWRWLWGRLLGHVELPPEKEQPQAGKPGAATGATVTSGRQLLWSDDSDDNTPRPYI